MSKQAMREEAERLIRETMEKKDPRHQAGQHADRDGLRQMRRAEPRRRRKKARPASNSPASNAATSKRRCRALHRVGVRQRRTCAVPTIHLAAAMVGTLRFAHPAAPSSEPCKNSPTGKSPKVLSSPSKKIFRLTRRANQGYISAVSPDKRGGSRSSRTCGGMRWTQWPRLTSVAEADGEVVWSWRPDAGVKYLQGSLHGATEAKEPGHRGEHEISRKATAQGKPDASAEPVCSCAFSSVHIAHETAGAARTRPSLRPLFLGRANDRQTSAQNPPRERELISLQSSSLAQRRRSYAGSSKAPR